MPDTEILRSPAAAVNAPSATHTAVDRIRATAAHLRARGATDLAGLLEAGADGATSIEADAAEQFAARSADKPVARLDGLAHLARRRWRRVRRPSARRSAVRRPPRRARARHRVGARRRAHAPAPDDRDSDPPPRERVVPAGGVA
jgi:hypothetical protein